MSRCTHNDHPGLEPCKNEGIGEHGYCAEHGCCLCGGVMLADTEDWKVYLCFDCLGLHFDAFFGQYYPYVNSDSVIRKLIDAAYEAGRKSVLGVPEPDEVVEKSR